MSLFEETKNTLEELKDSDNDRLQTIASRCVELESTQQQIKEAEQQLKLLKDKEFQLENESIPTLLEEVGMKSITLSSGSKVSIQEVYKAHISEENKPDAFAWLRENGFDDIIKNDIVVTFGRGEETMPPNCINAYAMRDKLPYREKWCSSVYSKSICQRAD